ncbi:hypothetical protein EDC01DRAFT_627876 [Geopyxis carbonaria]|nr:hypothetical protein EDC01DRAFT_627876 [Geopyxis carbonaria]
MAITFFFYGVLSDPETLAKVLAMDTPPTLVRANIRDYEIQLQGMHTTLVRGSPGCGSVVRGAAFELRSARDQERLEAYEALHYVVADCTIEFEDGREVEGKTFVSKLKVGEEIRIPRDEGGLNLKGCQTQ